MAKKKTPEKDEAEAQERDSADMPASGAEAPQEERTVAEEGSAPETEAEPDAESEALGNPDAGTQVEEPAPEGETASEDEPQTEEHAEHRAAEDDDRIESEPDAPEPETESAPDPDEITADVATVAEVEEAQAAESETPGPGPVTKIEQVTIRQGGFWSMLFGGIVAAGIGVAAAPYILPEILPKGLLSPAEDAVDPAELQERIAAQETALGDLRSTVEGITPAPDLSGEVSGLSETLTGFTDQLNALEGRIAALEDRPAPETGGGGGVSDAALDELREALDAQRETLRAQRERLDTQRAALEAQRAEIDALKGEAEAEEAAARDSARATLQRAALTRVTTALDTGDEFTAALTDLRDTGVEVPAALADVAEGGVPTQGALIESFPEAARAALATVRSAEGGAVSSVGGFFKSQLGIRSLEPREGDDPDAVLSRAEAALRGGRLEDALAEIETLPEGARAAMSDWAAEAERRTAALSAADALAGTLN